MSKTKSTSIDKELKEKIKEFEGKQKELKKAEKALADDVVNALKTIIQSADHIEAVRWQQYTPGFNDGDPCEFTIAELEVKFSDKIIKEFKNEEAEDEDEEGDFIQDYDVENFLKKNMDVLNHDELGRVEKQYEALQKLYGTLSSMEGALRARFGDGIQITVNKKGIETEDYDCGY